MNRAWKRLAVILAIAALVEFGLLLSTHQTVKELKTSLGNLSAQWSNDAVDLRNQMSRLSGRLEEQLEQKASLLTDSQVGVDYQDGKLQVEVSVTPKEIRDEETVFVSVNGTWAKAETMDGLSYTATVPADLCDLLDVAVQFESEAGKRQEVLEPVYAGDLLYFCVTSGTGNGGFWLQLVPNEVSGFAPYEEPLSMEVQVFKYGNQVGTLELEPASELPPEDEPPYMSWQDWTNSGQGMGWYADLSSYQKEQDEADYELYLSLTIEGGLCYFDKVGDFSADPNFGSGLSSYLYPLSELTSE